MERINDINQFNKANTIDQIVGFISAAIENPLLQRKMQTNISDVRPFLRAMDRMLIRSNLQQHDWKERFPEKSEKFVGGEAQLYIDGCDYLMTADDLLLALEMQNLFGPAAIRRMKILDVMCGPGRLGREFLSLGTQHIVFHDGDEIMITHARNQAFKTMQSGQSIGFITSDIDNITIPDNSFDLVISHNAIHQMANIDRLGIAMRELVRITALGGHVVIADYQRKATPEFLELLEERLVWTKPKIRPLLLPSFFAAFSQEEFCSVLSPIPGIRWEIADAKEPILTPKMAKRVAADHVKGHLMDYSAISLRVNIQKEQI